jgi:hypothetical protein
MNTITRTGIVAGISIGAIASAASASITVFTDRASWEAAVGGAPITVEDFNSTAPQPIADGSTLDTGLLQIKRDGSANGGDGDLAISDGSTFGDFDGTNFLDGETGIAPHERVDFGFNGQSVFAFGADFVSPFSGDGIALEVGGQLFNIDTISGFDSGFFGIVDTSATYSTISIVGTPEDISFQELWQADNVSYAVPSPGAAGLLAFAGLAATRRRR